MKTESFIKEVRSRASVRLEAGTLACPTELVEWVLTEYLAGSFGAYELDLGAVDEVLQIAEQQAAGLDPSREEGLVFGPRHMLMETPTAELLGIRVQALVSDVVDKARKEIMEKALEPVTLPVPNAVEAGQWIEQEEDAGKWTEDERRELGALHEELRSVTARIASIDAGAHDLDRVRHHGIEFPLGGNPYPVAQITSHRGGLPVLAEHTRLIAAATGAPAPSVTLHILTGKRLEYAPVTMDSIRFATPLDVGLTTIRKEVRFVFRTPDIDQAHMRSLHRVLRDQYSAGHTKSLDAGDAELFRLVWDCLVEERPLPPFVTLLETSQLRRNEVFGLTIHKLFETVRKRLLERGRKYKNWRGPYQRFRRITDRLDRTISVILADFEEDAKP